MLSDIQVVSSIIKQSEVPFLKKTFLTFDEAKVRINRIFYLIVNKKWESLQKETKEIDFIEAIILTNFFIHNNSIFHISGGRLLFDDNQINHVINLPLIRKSVFEYYVVSPPSFNYPSKH